MRVGVTVCAEHLGYASGVCSGICNRAAVLAGDKDGHVSADGASGREHVEGDGVEGVVVVFSDDENAHVFPLLRPLR